MFCPQCGAENQDGSLACSQCGTAFSQNPNPIPQRLLDKKEYFNTIASDNAKMMRKVALIVGIICLAFTIASAFIINNSPIFNIPFLSMVSDDFDEFEEEYDDLLDEYKDLDEDEIKDVEKESGMDIEEIEKFLENPSLSNFEYIFKLMDKEDDVFVFSVFQIVIIGYALFIALFQLLAVLFKKSGLVIAAIIISIPYFVFFASLWMWLVFLLLNISQLTIYINTNKEYKNYRRSLLNQF